MKLEDMKDAYNSYNEELDVRKDLLTAILTNKDYSSLQEKYLELYNKNNSELYPIIGKVSTDEIHVYLNQVMFNPEYHGLVKFFLILLSYSQIKDNGNNAQKFSENESSLYYKLVRWYLPIHGLSNKDREEVIDELNETTTESVSIRNILANKEELNEIFDNIQLSDDFERKLAVTSFVNELDLLITFVNLSVIKNKILNRPNDIPKSLLLRLVVKNLLARKYQLGFRVEEYLTRYYQNHDILKEIFGDAIKVDKRVLNDYIEEYILEINDITNEFTNYLEKKGKTH